MSDTILRKTGGIGRLGLMAGLALAVLGPREGLAEVDLSTATIADLQRAMDAGTLTSERLVRLYLARIEAYDKKGPALNTVLALNPRAVEIARELDAERREKGPRSPLHGIPILAKDVFDTVEMPTSGGFKPMATSQPVRDSFVIARLRKAGAIILAKLNQSDWYGVAPTGGSTLGGQVLSPYNPRKFAGGSSSGTGAAMAAWFGTVGLGSDTGGSIVIPATLNNNVGISSTHGLVSRTGMMWSSPMQENGGPMGRSVYDCAAVLDAIAGFDPADLVTLQSLGKIPDQPYTSFVSAEGLVGARIGVLREMFRSGEQHREGLALMDQTLADLRAGGAVLVDPVRTGIHLIEAQVHAGSATFERAFAIDHYLAGLGPNAPIRSVKEMIEKGGDIVKPTIIEAAKIESLDHHKELFAAIRQKDMIRSALVGLMDQFRLDALVLPFRTMITEEIPVGTNRPPDIRNNLSSYTGLPTIIVPGGFFPSDGMPFGVQLLGRPFSEPTLIRVASGYEARTRHRRAPASTPPLAGEILAY
ncbi:MAG: amidase [Verrucomicrobiae bacterium]|nr:amidase [Verrucomicrobiae bacterium]